MQILQEWERLLAIGIAQTVNKATSAIAASSTEISVTVEQQERAASQPATSVHETTTTNGKGFAVVAAEIRKLADQSKGSAEKINTLVTDI